MRSVSELVSNKELLPFSVDRGIGERASLGLLVLRTDQTIEDEFRHLLPHSGVALYGARLFSDTEITPENLLKMEAHIAPTVQLLPDVDFAAVGFACTSGALVIGEALVAERVLQVLPHARVTDPVTATIAAFKALGVERIALLTPYMPDINHRLRDALQERGLIVSVMGSFNEPDDDVVARIDQRSIENAICAIGEDPACDAVFVSCTSLRVARRVAAIEARIAKPVTSSNHALAWHMLRLAGIDDPVGEHGRLFTVALSA